MTTSTSVETLRLLVAQNSLLSQSAKLTALYSELNRLLAIRTAKHDSRWLLSVLHTTRALDTTLSELLTAKRWGAGTNLNAHLKVLAQHNVVTAGELAAFRKEIVHKRNKYMHEAGPRQINSRPTGFCARWRAASPLSPLA